jgi:hemoglobin
MTLYEAVGGEAWFAELVERFYEGVEVDQVLTAMYPDDLTDSKAHLAGFLVQYWGGPTAYSDERGHPRLRMRHAPFVIGAAERDSWLGAMRKAVESMSPGAEIEAALVEYFEMAAAHMINRA